MPYNQNEVNKKILARPPKVYPESEMVGPLGRYRDQNREIYERKGRQFLETANVYRKHNELALIQNKVRLGRFADDVLRYDFEKPVKEVRWLMSGEIYCIFVLVQYVPDVDEEKGLLLRRRTERAMYEV